MLFIATIYPNGGMNKNGASETWVYDSKFGGWEQFHKDTFSPFCEWDIVALKVKGKTYQERKNDLINTAIHYQYLERSGLSWGELATIGNWFETQAKRYGLINEFRENAII